MSDVCGECGLEFSNTIHSPDCNGYSPMAPLPVTLRDQFAMATLTGIMAHSCSKDLSLSPNSEIAIKAFDMADAMLEARKIK